MKICPKCGATTTDDAVFCTSCGNKFEQEIANATEAAKETIDTAENTVNTTNSAESASDKAKDIAGKAIDGVSAGADKLADGVAAGVDKLPENIKNKLPKNKKALLGICAAAVVVVILLLVLLVNALGRSKKETVKDYFKALEKQDGKAYVNLCYPKKYLDDIVDELENDDIDNVNDLYDYIEEEVLEAYYDEFELKSLEFKKIKTGDDVEDYDTDDIEEYFDDNFDIDIKVKDVAEVKVKYKYKDDDGTETSTKTFILYKVGNNWYIFN